MPFRSASTRFATPALMSDWVPMIDRVRPAQFTMMVVSGSGATRPARSTNSAPGTLTEPGMFMVAYSSNRRTSSTAILALPAISAATSSAGSDGVCRRELDQFAKSLGVGIHVLKQFVASRLPGLQSPVELTNIGVSQCLKAIHGLRNKTFARVVDNDRHILARQSRRGFERDPLSRHVGGEQRMAGGKGGFVPQIEQRDFIAQQQRAADLRGRDGGSGHEMAGLDANGLMSMAGSLARLRLPIPVQFLKKVSIVIASQRVARMRAR